MAKTPRGGAKRARARAAASSSGDKSGDQPQRVTLGSGAAIGLAIDQPDVGDTGEDTFSARVTALQQSGSGVLERQPVSTKNGRVNYRWRFHAENGDVLSGNGDSNEAAFDDLERKLSKRED